MKNRSYQFNDESLLGGLLKKKEDEAIMRILGGGIYVINIVASW
jgi:hypothetical protein